MRAYDCMIWDEINMVSRRILEIASMVHHKLSSECDAFEPLGGKQLILVGDFLQLPPVPNLFDPGKFAFYSLWNIEQRLQIKLTLRFVECNGIHKCDWNDWLKF